MACYRLPRAGEYLEKSQPTKGERGRHQIVNRDHQRRPAAGRLETISATTAPLGTNHAPEIGQTNQQGRGNGQKGASYSGFFLILKIIKVPQSKTWILKFF